MDLLVTELTKRGVLHVMCTSIARAVYEYCTCCVRILYVMCPNTARDVTNVYLEFLGCN